MQSNYAKAQTVIQSDTLSSKNNPAADSLKINSEIVKDTLKPVLSFGILDRDKIGYRNTSKEIRKIDYRNVGQLFDNFPAAYFADLGQLGSPSEIFMYGLGFRNTTFLEEQVSINNPYFNVFDLNTYQSERIGMIEILPLSRAFSIGFESNPTAVNFIRKDEIGIVPRTRIRLMQGPNSEGFVDVRFNRYMTKKINLNFDVTNYNTVDRFLNSSTSGWQTALELKYYLSNNHNIKANYTHVNSQYQINGGVDNESVQSLIATGEDPDLLFNESLAPVTNSTSYKKIKANNLRLDLMSKSGENFNSLISLYHNSELQEFRSNELLKSDIDPFIKNEHEVIRSGLSANARLTAGMFRVNSNAGFESLSFDSDLSLIKKDSRIYAGITGSADLIENFLRPSVTLKYSKNDLDSYSGLGFDLLLNLKDELSLFMGYSSFERSNNYIDYNLLLQNSNLNFSLAENLSPIFIHPGRTNTLEVKANYATGKTNAAVKYFRIENENIDQYFVDKIILTNSKPMLNGINLFAEMEKWNILLTTNFTLYPSAEESDYFGQPQFTLNTGIYYVDTLFNENLKLKTGLNFKAIGTQKVFKYDFETYTKLNYSYYPEIYISSYDLNDRIEAAQYSIDFYLAGNIQNLATVYFIFENILNNQYYFVPYYPKQERGLRFGVSWDINN
ncbi:MAG: hypothetical protein K9I99_17750 [Melioribacteraceae bacterium]|nr:hypothetical protein [Melioribacteraceae bacterium]